MQCKAILFDTRSIQRYIYSGNKLRTNIGASYLVDTVYDEVLFPLLEARFGKQGVDMESWRKGEKLESLPADVRCMVGSNGGGNLMLLMHDSVENSELKDIVAEFSRELLVKRPGLHIGAAFDEQMRLDDAKGFQEDLDRLYKKLKENQMTVFPEVNVAYTGLTLSCPVNGEAANYLDEKGKVQPGGSKELHFFSQEAACKSMAADGATKNLKALYPAISDKYDFPTLLDQLGQRSQENYISIVHIDGNNMGAKFRACADQAARSRLSEDMRRKTEGCFGKLLESIDAEYNTYRDFLDVGEEYAEKGGKPLLPIRPLILGGDDVTFVCPAKLALRFTKRFIEYMMQEDSVKGLESGDAKKVDCCAGIAILKTSYPFFRGYQLAEQLCDEAKKVMRSQKTESDKPCAATSWLDFAILHGEQAPTLNEIRNQEYRGARGNMHFGPYQVGHDLGDPIKERRFDIENLIEAVHQLQRGSKPGAKGTVMAMNKIKKLRSVLQHGKHEAQEFLMQLKQQDPVQSLPDIPEWAVFADEDNAMWSGGNSNCRTPYVDAIEMMDFIPEEA